MDPTASSTPDDQAHRSSQTITLRVDLRALAALGGALIIIGSFLPWVSAQFQPIVRVIGPATSGGWPILIFGVLAIVLQFWPPFRTPRVSLPAAALGFAAGVMALASALNTIGLGRTLMGESAVSPLIGRRHRHLSHAGRIADRRAGRAGPAADQSRTGPRRTAFVESVHRNLCRHGGAVRLECGAVWIMDRRGGSTGRAGTPTPSALDAGLLATPLINVEVESIGGRRLHRGQSPRRM